MLIERGLNLTIHTINCLLIYVIFGMTQTSFLASLLFAVNPVGLQAGLWISGRNYSKATMLALAPMLFDIRLWFLSLPIFVICLNGGFKLRGGVRNKMTNSKGTNRETNTIAPRKFILFTKTLKYYVFLCLFNPRLGFFHAPMKAIGATKRYDEENYSLNSDFWIGMGILYVMLTNIFFNYSPIMFGLVWFLYNFLIWSNIITIQMIIAERYIYCANIGLMLVLAYVLPVPYVYMLIAWYACRNWHYQESFRNEYWLNAYNVSEQKDNWYAWNAIGQKEAVDNNITGALKCFMEAYKHNPYDFRVLMNIVHCYFLMGDVKNIDRFMGEAEKNIYDDKDCADYLNRWKGFVDKLKITGQVKLSELSGKVGFLQ